MRENNTGFDDFKPTDFFDTSSEQDGLFARRPQNRFVKPRYHKPIKSRLIKYDNAEKLAYDIATSGWIGERIDCLCAGNFVFGDFIEAFIKVTNITVQKLRVSTLGMSHANVASFENLLDDGIVKELDLMVSAYFYAHERRKLVEFIYKKLDKDNRFQLSVCANHTKIVLIDDGKHRFVISGSANLRSSDCIEQFSIENNQELFDFYAEYFDTVATHYNSIDKTCKQSQAKTSQTKILRGKTLWQTVVRD